MFLVALRDAEFHRLLRSVASGEHFWQETCRVWWNRPSQSQHFSFEKMTMLDDALSELASGSLPLLEVGGPTHPSWSRSLSELKAANEAILGGQQALPSSAAQSILGEPTDFGRLAASLETPKQVTQEAFVSIEATLRQHRDNILDRILQKEREQTRQITQQLVEKQLEEDWKREREWWIKEIVGTRTLGGSANHLLLPQSGALSHSFRGTVPYRGHSGDSISAQMDDRSVQAHLEVTKTIDSSSLLSTVIPKYINLSTSGSAQDSGYTTAWQLLSCMLTQPYSPIDAALGALVHFCKQFQNLISNHVRSASLAGVDVSPPQTYGSGFVGTVASYVKLEFGAKASIWHIIYLCKLFLEILKAPIIDRCLIPVSS